MEIAERLIEKYSWVIDAYVWLQVIGTIIGIAIFVCMAVFMVSVMRKKAKEHEVDEARFAERRKQFEKEHEEIKAYIKQKRQDFDKWR